MSAAHPHLGSCRLLAFVSVPSDRLPLLEPRGAVDWLDVGTVSVAFHEIIRQVSVNCLERGYLMGKIWWSEMELFQRLLSLHRRSAAKLATEQKERESERQTMQQRIAELEREVATLKAEAA